MAWEKTMNSYERLLLNLLDRPGTYQVYVNNQKECAVYKLQDNQVLITTSSHRELSREKSSSRDAG